MADSPLHVMQLTCELAPAGAERIVYELARGLASAGHKATVVSIKPATGAVAEWLADAEIEVRDLGVTSRLAFGAKARLRRIVAEARPDVLHTHMFHANVLGRSAASGMARLGVASSLHVVERRWRPWRAFLERWGARRADRIVCVSEAVRRHAEREMGMPAGKVQVIYNGVDGARVRPTAHRADVLLRLGVDPEARTVGFVGRFDRQKGPDLLVRSCRQFLHRASEARVIMVGHGPMESKLKRLVKELGYEKRFAWAGFRDDVGNLLQCMDVFAFPSRWEGFGLSLVEAMLAERPIVASKVDSVPELVEDAKSAMLADPGDHVRLGKSILWLLTQPERARELAAAARQRAEDLFGLQAMIEGHLELYSRIARDRRGNP